MSQQINLYNPILLRQKRYFAANTMLQALGLIALGAIGVTLFAWFQVAALSRQVREVQQARTNEEARMQRVAPHLAPKAKNPLLRDEIQRVEAQIKAREQASFMLKSTAFGNTQGYSEYMRAFSRQAIDGVWLTGFVIAGAGNELDLKGKLTNAALLPTYIEGLSKEPVLRGRTFATLEMQRPSDAKDNTNILEFHLRSRESAAPK